MRKIHYGWFICFACMLQLFVATGLPNAAFGVHLPYILAETDFTNAQGSLVISVRNFSSLIAMLLVDRFYNVLDMRKGLVAFADLFSGSGFGRHCQLIGWHDPGFCLDQ